MNVDAGNFDTFIQKIDDVLDQKNPNPDEISTLIGIIIGEDPLEDSMQTQSRISQLRKESKLIVLFELADKLERAISSVSEEDKDFIPVYKKMASKAKEIFKEQVAATPSVTIANVSNNTFTAANFLTNRKVGKPR